MFRHCFGALLAVRLTFIWKNNTAKLYLVSLSYPQSTLLKYIYKYMFIWTEHQNSFFSVDWILTNNDKSYSQYIFHSPLKIKQISVLFRNISFECWIMKIPINVPQDRNPIIERRWVWTIGNWSWLLIILCFIINGR